MAITAIALPMDDCIFELVPVLGEGVWDSGIFPKMATRRASEMNMMLVRLLNA